jgi:ankyrin repeat protein
MYASVGMVEELETLINGGVDVNYRNEKDATALYFASKYGNEECVRILLAAGADKNLAVRSTGFTPYLIAVKYERREIILILKEAGCDTSVRDIRGRDAAAIVRVYNLNLKEDEI